MVNMVQSSLNHGAVSRTFNGQPSSYYMHVSNTGGHVKANQRGQSNSKEQAPLNQLLIQA